MSVASLRIDDERDTERRAVMETVARFCDRAVRKLGERPESAPSQDDMARAVTTAAEAGLLPSRDAPDLGLWAGEQPEDRRLSAEILAAVARHSTAAAFHLHQTALGLRLARALAVERGAPQPSLHPGVGLAKGLVGARLVDRSASHVRELPAGAPLATLPLAEASRPSLVHAAEPWDSLLVPVWDRAATHLSWVVVDRRELSAIELSHSHGLEGIATFEVALDGLPAPLGMPAAASLALYRGALALDAIGLVAMGIGSARAAVASASEYARERRQGGKLIVEHAAVRLLLGGADADLTAVEAMLEAMVVSSRDLRRVLLLRSSAHPLLCRAANSALQVFGGYGYMRDFGLERAVRDNNHLRLSSGTPSDLVLTALAMEDVR